MSLLGEAYLGLREFDKAESFLIESYEKLVELEPKIPVRAKSKIQDAKARIAELFDAKGMPDKAAEYRD